MGGQVTKDLKDIETETPNTLELILKQKQTGVSDIEIGTQIVQYLQNTSAKVNEVTNRGYQEIEKSNQESHNREQTLKYWKNVCDKVLKALQCLMDTYFEQKLNVMERSIVQQIKEGSSKFRLEIEGYLTSADLTFEKMNIDLKTAMGQVAKKFNESDEKNAQVEGVLRMLLEQQQQTQLAWEHDRKIRERETEDVSKKFTQMYNVMEKQQHMFATSHQAMKKELLQEMSKNTEYGVPSEIRSVPPGLSKGSDDRGLGAKRDPPPEGTEEKGPKGNYYLKENDSPNDRKD